MLTAESAPLAVAHSRDWMLEQMSTMSSELTVAHLTATDMASFSSSNYEVKAAPLLSSEWMMTGEAGSLVVATIAAPTNREPSVAEASM